MGKHFDTLVELLNKGHITDSDGPELYGYLCDAVKESAVFGFPLLSEEIRPQSSQDLLTYSHYVGEYVTLSQERGNLLLAPYPVTAVEDSTSVVLFESSGPKECIITVCEESNDNPNPELQGVHLQVGRVTLNNIDEAADFNMDVGPIYDATWRNGEKYVRPLFTQAESQATSDRLGTCAMAAMQQIIYISDPGNFILKQENNGSKKMNKKKRGCKKQRKTQIRPHFTIHSRDELVRILRGEIGADERVPHPVRGHWRFFKDPKYRLKATHVGQHWRGLGDVSGKNGIHYEVLLKTDFGELTSASQHKAKT
jgi:hypothetical protein